MMTRELYRQLRRAYLQRARHFRGKTRPINFSGDSLDTFGEFLLTYRSDLWQVMQCQSILANIRFTYYKQPGQRFIT